MTSARGGLFDRIAGWAVDHPWRTLLVGVLLVAAVFPGLKKVKPNTHQRIWVEPGHEILNNLDEFETKFGSDVASIERTQRDYKKRIYGPVADIGLQPDVTGKVLSPMLSLAFRF
jgi:predicted RND superfamily exporter protein